MARIYGPSLVCCFASCNCLHCLYLEWRVYKIYVVVGHSVGQNMFSLRWLTDKQQDVLTSGIVDITENNNIIGYLLSQISPFIGSSPTSSGHSLEDLFHRCTSLGPRLFDSCSTLSSNFYSDLFDPRRAHIPCHFHMLLTQNMTPSKNKRPLPSSTSMASHQFSEPPETFQQWKTALEQVNILYLRGQWKHCSALCNTLLLEAKNQV